MRICNLLTLANVLNETIIINVMQGHESCNVVPIREPVSELLLERAGFVARSHIAEYIVCSGELLITKSSNSEICLSDDGIKDIIFGFAALHDPDDQEEFNAWYERSSYKLVIEAIKLLAQVPDKADFCFNENRVCSTPYEIAKNVNDLGYIIYNSPYLTQKYLLRKLESKDIEEADLDLVSKLDSLICMLTDPESIREREIANLVYKYQAEDDAELCAVFVTCTKSGSTDLPKTNLKQQPRGLSS